MLQFLNSLKVPPAWKDVKISRSKNSRVLATGIDSAGRLQYIYHPKFRAKKEREKFERILKFARALPKMRETVEQDMASRGLSRNKVLACVVRLMDEAYFRIGNDQYARQNQHYGLSTLRSKHVSVSGNTVTFDFVGKSGQRQLKQLSSRRLANIIKELDDLPGYEIFKYYDERDNLVKVSSAEVNSYIKEIMGEEFSAKDFRTWGGTLLASAELVAVERPNSIKERKKAVTACVKKVARRLGNTPAIARSSYIDPRIISSFVDNDDLREVRRTIRQINSQYLTSEERCVLKLLEKAA
jgi:DNA topoisomerase-1